MDEKQATSIIEAVLFASEQPLSLDKLLELFTEQDNVTRDDIRSALNIVAHNCKERSVELNEVSSGFRFQVKQDYAPWVCKLWEARPARYSRALLETLALIAYRQPITRGEIEQIRGVGVSTSIMKTLLERGWVRIVGHRDVPGKPALYATTREFLDNFNLKCLEELPSLKEIRDIDTLGESLELEFPTQHASQQADEIPQELPLPGLKPVATQDDTNETNDDSDGGGSTLPVKERLTVGS